MSELENENHLLLDRTAILELSLAKAITTVDRIEGSICCCRDRLLLPKPHLAPEDEEMVEDSEEEEEDGLEYVTNEEEADNEASDSSYLTLIPTPGVLPAVPSTRVPTRLPTPDHGALGHPAIKTIKSRIRDFLEEAEDDLELGSPPPLESSSPSPIPVPAPLLPPFEGFIPFSVSPTSTGQRYVPSHGLPCTHAHPYFCWLQGRCCCEPGGWCDHRPCHGSQPIARKIVGDNPNSWGRESSRRPRSSSEQPPDQSHLCHRYDFLVCYRNELNFFKLFKLLFFTRD